MDIAFWIGGLIPTGLLTFLSLWLLRKFVASRIAAWLIANVLSISICTAVIGAFNLAEGAGPNFAAGFVAYLVPQLIWLVLSFFVSKGRAVQTGTSR